ncbi:MAG TPA: rhomboid family intramembrane serine protease [Xanthobacteraceae bacterium]|nr:rhomboid family intramembrane serine protease [Xanthobacteraceae bacterium]
MARPSEPIFNIPPVILWLCGTMALVHGARAFLDEGSDLSVLLWFAFIPARYDAALAASLQFPGGIAADLWTFVTYAFLHAEILHIAVNLVWLLAFGSAVAWRFGAPRFLLFFAASAAAGAGAFLFTHFGDLVPLVGASGAISGAMAAACRFVFAEDGPLGVLRGRDRAAYLIPAVPLREALKNRRVAAFLGVWFVLNFLFGLSALSENFTNATVAWEAHLGGFVSGLLLFPFFDPVPRFSGGAPLAPRGGEEDD